MCIAKGQNFTFGRSSLSGHGERVQRPLGSNFETGFLWEGRTTRTTSFGSSVVVSILPSRAEEDSGGVLLLLLLPLSLPQELDSKKPYLHSRQKKKRRRKNLSFSAFPSLCDEEFRDVPFRLPSSPFLRPVLFFLIDPYQKWRVYLM